MTDASTDSTADQTDLQPAETGDSADKQFFLCVVDDSKEMRVALRFAARRAKHTGGRVALLYVMEPADFQHWMSVEERMREEAREAAERVLQDHASQVQEIGGTTPALYLREGSPAEQIQQLIEEEPRVRILVLGAGTEKKGPGPLVSSIVAKSSGRFPIPITVVPGNLTEEQIDALT